MNAQATRSIAVRQALTSQSVVTLAPSEQELQLLTSYVLGHISLQEANDLLKGQGLIMVALYQAQLVIV